MKFCRLIAFLWVILSCSLLGQYSSVQNNNANPQEGGPSTRELDPTKWDGEVGKDGQIPVLGHIIEVGEEFIQVLVWNNKLRVYFLDAEEVVVEPKVDLVTARLDILRDDDVFLRLRPQGLYMEGVEFLRPPFIFRPTILRIQKSGDEEDDIYSFGFKQDYID